MEVLLAIFCADKLPRCQAGEFTKPRGKVALAVKAAA